MRHVLRIVTAAAATAALAGSAQAQVVRAGAGSLADATTALNAFRADLGTLNPNQPGTFGSGRREINWDGVPDTASDPNFFPGNFFNGATPGRARGANFSTPGAGFLTSADSSNPTNTQRDFASINPNYAGQFEAFSPQRLFTAVDSTITDVTFFIPGTLFPATTTGFGSIFSDVDLHDSTRIELYDINDQLLTSQFAPAAGIGSETFSFLGISYTEAIVARVRIYSGNTALGAGIDESFGLRGTDRPTDLVVMDDFVYGEPVPTPGAGILAALALGCGGLRRRRR